MALIAHEKTSLTRTNGRSINQVVSKGEQTRQTILEHAARKAAQVGLGGLTIGALSRELGMSKSGLFAHFRSKEALQVMALQRAAEQFTDEVIRPALKAPRGEKRVRALFDGWLDWVDVKKRDTGCLFITAATEFDDQKGPVRQSLVDQQRDLLELLAGVVRTAMKQGDFRDDIDPEQFAYEGHGIILGYHHAARLMGDPQAAQRARVAFERLVAQARRA